MLTAAPMDRQNDFVRCLVNIGDDIGDESTQELLTGARGDARSIPSGIEILGKPNEIRRDYAPICSLNLGQSGLARLDTAQRGFPILLQLCRDQPIVWIAGGIAPLRERSLILGLLKLQFDDASVFGLALHVHPLGFECGVDRHRFNRPEKLPRNSGFNPHSTEGQTPRQTQHKVWTFTTIDRPSRWATTIAYR
jgi:hypothetical protein